MTRVLVTGICGSLAQLCARSLLDQGHEVIGVDYRRARPDIPEGVVFYQANYNKRVIADVFRQHKPQRVLHLGRVGNLKTHANKRFDLNVMGSAKIMELSLEHQVEFGRERSLEGRRVGLLQGCAENVSHLLERDWLLCAEHPLAVGLEGGARRRVDLVD